MPTLKTIFSGIKPSGSLHLGQYLGALSQWVAMQDSYNCIFSVVDYHAITVKQDPDQLRSRILEIAKIYLAAGLDPKKSIIFQQSAIPAHTELAWIFNCYGTHIADLNKMTQFKDKAGKNQESVSVGLYDYPVLMAADILLYDTDIVPVGEDQKQHVELARDIARRFNSEFGSIFKLPQAVVRVEGARIMSLQDPTRKMSKSDDNPNNYIGLLDDVATAQKKIIRAVTDSGSEIIYDAVNKPALANLLTIYALLGGRQIKRLEKDYAGRGYGEFKKDLAEIVGQFLTDFQQRYNNISDQDVSAVLDDGRQKIAPRAEEKLAQVRKLIGVR
jgi:tryptophanyl-tRNA synthetase